MQQRVFRVVVERKEEHLRETELVGKKLDRIDQEIREGKRRLLSADEALGKFAKLAK